MERIEKSIDPTLQLVETDPWVINLEEQCLHHHIRGKNKFEIRFYGIDFYGKIESEERRVVKYNNESNNTYPFYQNSNWESFEKENAKERMFVPLNERIDKAKKKEKMLLGSSIKELIEELDTKLKTKDDLDEEENDVKESKEREIIERMEETEAEAELKEIQELEGECKEEEELEEVKMESRGDTSSTEDESGYLWVDKYKAENFSELLSEEKINRDVLKWLKSWDELVFKRTQQENPFPFPSFPQRRVILHQIKINILIII